MRRTLTFLYVFLSLYLPAFTYGQAGFVTFVGTRIIDASGNKAASATVCIQASSQGIPYSVLVGSVGGQTILIPTCTNVSNGTFSMLAPDTSITVPVNACFALTVTDNNTGAVLLKRGYECMQFTSAQNNWCNQSICTLDNFHPNTPIVGSYIPLPGPKGDTGAASVVTSNGSNGDFNVGRNLTSVGTMYAQSYIGTMINSQSSTGFPGHGTTLGWNYANGTGESGFFNSRGGGGGGFHFYGVSSSGIVDQDLGSIDSGGTWHMKYLAVNNGITTLNPLGIVSATDGLGNNLFLTGALPVGSWNDIVQDNDIALIGHVGTNAGLVVGAHTGAGLRFSASSHDITGNANVNIGNHTFSAIYLEALKGGGVVLYDTTNGQKYVLQITNGAINLVAIR